MKHGLRDRMVASRRNGPNGNYLFELEAQPGGPEGRSDTTAGSKPILTIERPRNVRPLVLPFSWTREPARRRFVPYPVTPLKPPGTHSASSQSRLRCLCHTWYDAMNNRTQLTATVAGVADFLNSYTYDALQQLTQETQMGQTGGNGVAPKGIGYSYNLDSQVTQVLRFDPTTASPHPCYVSR